MLHTSSYVAAIQKCALKLCVWGGGGGEGGVDSKHQNLCKSYQHHLACEELKAELCVGVQE